MQHEHLAVLGRQPEQGRADVGAANVLISGVCAGRTRGDINAQHRPPAAARDGPALIGDYRQKPRPHLGAGPQVVQLAPGPDRPLLHRVLGRVTIVKHPVGEPKRLVDKRPHELVERLSIAALRAGDQICGGRKGHWVCPVYAVTRAESSTDPKRNLPGWSQRIHPDAKWRRRRKKCA